MTEQLDILGEDALRERLIGVRREMHAEPELSWAEFGTADRIRAFLDTIGLDHRTMARTGVVAEVPGRRRDVVVALCADIDALPIHEETGLAFASGRDGVMHACGHDAHTAMLLGAAALLARDPPPPVTVRLIFQPAEEVAEGALAMIAGGALEDVAMIFGGHVDRHYPVGSIIVSEGSVNAFTDQFQIVISGRGSHGARPHEGVDAVVVGTLMVQALQTIVSREVNPAHPSVVTIGRFDAGTAANVIAAKATLIGTIRAQEAQIQESLIKAIDRMARAVGDLHGAGVEFELTTGTHGVSNTPEMVAIARPAAESVVGPENVRTLETANMGAEDFGEYLRNVRGCYVRFGVQTPGRESYPAHSSRFDIDEAAIWIGARYFQQIARAAGGDL